MRSHGLARHKLRATLTPKKNSLSDDFDKMDKYLCHWSSAVADNV